MSKALYASVKYEIVYASIEYVALYASVDLDIKGLHPTYKEKYPISDIFSINFNRVIPDTYTVNDLISIVPEKNIIENINVINTLSIKVDKGFVEGFNNVDTAYKTFSTTKEDTVSLFDSVVPVMHKVFQEYLPMQDAPAATDNVQFSFDRFINEPFTCNDVMAIETSKNPEDDVIFTESLMVVQQSYADLGYFRDDYVGSVYTL